MDHVIARPMNPTATALKNTESLSSMRPLRSILPRVWVFRTAAPKHLSPLLPTTRARLTLTNATRPVRFFHHFPARLTNSPPRSPQLDPNHVHPPNATLSERLRHLIKTYGWYALGVYFLFSVADFGIAFVGVNLLGAEYVSSVAASVKLWVASVLHSKPPEPGKDEIESMTNPVQTGNEGLYAMLVLAYTIHKTLFVPLRIGLTAAFTPRIVSWLTKRGWVGSAGARRAAEEMRDKLRRK